MTDQLLKFFATAARLKTLKRTGWQRSGVEPSESVAEHTFGVALLALLLPTSAGLKVDRQRCVAMALVHDLAESIVGDLTPHDPISPEEKHRRERQAIDELVQTLGDDEPRRLWAEFEAAQSDEAQLVRDLDVIEMAWQAVTYRDDGKLSAAAAEQFVNGARDRVRTDAGQTLLQQILLESHPSK